METRRWCLQGTVSPCTHPRFLMINARRIKTSMYEGEKNKEREKNRERETHVRRDLRLAKKQFVIRTGNTMGAPWIPRISFRQGVDSNGSLRSRWSRDRGNRLRLLRLCRAVNRLYVSIVRLVSLLFFFFYLIRDLLPFVPQFPRWEVNDQTCQFQAQISTRFYTSHFARKERE